MKIIKDYFSFTKSELRGLIVVLAVIMGLIILKVVLHSGSEEFVLNSQPSDENVQDTIPHQKEIRYSDPERNFSNETKPYTSVAFDPNTASYYDLTDRGFSHFVAQRIIKYRTKGGRFNNPDDLLKIYGIDSSLVATLSEEIKIEDNAIFYRENNKEQILSNQIHIDINRADSIQLKEVNGIGKVLSVRIVKYRELLGGFYSPSQLTEVYGIHDSLYQKISMIFTIDTSCLEKININKASVHELEKHPYLTYHQARAITSYRRLVGPFESKKQLTDNYLLSELTFLKVAPYLALN